MEKKKRAFVLSGGGRLGSVQVGMLKALFEKNIIPDFFVGTSVGAINAAAISGDPSPEGVCRLEKIWLEVKQKDIFPLGIIGSVVKILRGKNYLVSPRGLRNLLLKHIPYHTFADAKASCFLVATDLLNGEEVVLSSGNIVDAVMASSALPGIFPPVELAGRVLIDGGISGNTPISVAANYGAKEIFILPAGYPSVLNKPPRGAIDIYNHSLGLLVGQQLLRDIEEYRERIVMHILPPAEPDNGLLNDLSSTAELLAAAYEETLRWLENGGMERFAIPGRMLPPTHWL